MIKIEWQEFNSPELGEVKYTGGMLFFNQNDEQKAISLDNKNISFVANEDGYTRIVYNDGVNTATAVSNEKFISGFYTEDGIPLGLQTNGIYNSLIDNSSSTKFPFSDVSNSISSSNAEDSSLVRRIAKTTTNKPKDVNFKMDSGGWAYINGFPIMVEGSMVGNVSSGELNDTPAQVILEDVKAPPRVESTIYPENPTDTESSIFPITANSSLSDISQGLEYDVLNCNNEYYNYLVDLELSEAPNPDNEKRYYHLVDEMIEPGYDSNTYELFGFNDSSTEKIIGINDRKVNYLSTPTPATKIYYGYYTLSDGVLFREPVILKFYSTSNRNTFTEFNIQTEILKTDIVSNVDGFYTHTDDVINTDGGNIPVIDRSFNYPSYNTDSIRKKILFYRFKNEQPLKIDSNGDYINDGSKRYEQTNNTTEMEPVYTSIIKWKLMILEEYNAALKQRYEFLIALDKTKKEIVYKNKKEERKNILRACTSGVFNNTKIVYNQHVRIQKIKENKQKYNNFEPGYTPAGGCRIPDNIFEGSNGIEDGGPAETQLMQTIAQAEITPATYDTIIENGNTYTTDNEYYQYLLTTNLNPPLIQLLENALIDKSVHYTFVDSHEDNIFTVIPYPNTNSQNYILNRSIHYKTMTITQRDLDLLKTNYGSYVYVVGNDELFKYNFPERWYKLVPWVSGNVDLTYQQLLYLIDLYSKKISANLNARLIYPKLAQYAYLANDSKYYTMFQVPGTYYESATILYFDTLPMHDLYGDVVYSAASIQDLLYKEVNVSTEFNSYTTKKLSSHDSLSISQNYNVIILDSIINSRPFTDRLAEENYYFVYNEDQHRIDTVYLRENKDFNTIFIELLDAANDISQTRKFHNHGYSGIYSGFSTSGNLSNLSLFARIQVALFQLLKNTYTVHEYIYSTLISLLNSSSYKDFSYREYAGGFTSLYTLADIQTTELHPDFTPLKLKIESGELNIYDYLTAKLAEDQSKVVDENTAERRNHKILEIIYGNIKIYISDIIVYNDYQFGPQLKRPASSFSNTEIKEINNAQKIAKGLLDFYRNVSIEDRVLDYCYDLTIVDNKIAIQENTKTLYIEKIIKRVANNIPSSNFSKLVIMTENINLLNDRILNNEFIEEQKDNIFVVFKDSNNVTWQLISNKLEFIDVNGNQDLNNSHASYIYKKLGI